MKLLDLYEEKTKKVRYDMVNVNGGFSDGVEIKPGDNPSVMNVSVNIYGGSLQRSHPYNVPKSIADLQQAYIAAQQSGDPVSTQIKDQLEAYYNNLRRAISLEIVALLKSFDEQANAGITRAVTNLNKKYQ